MKIGNGGTAGITRAKGFREIDKFGENNDIDTGTVPEVIYSKGGLFLFLDTAISMSLKSTSGNDTIAGSGAQKVSFEGFDNNNDSVELTLDTDGTNLVNIPTDLKIVTRAKVEQTGASDFNEGQIQFVDTATGLVVYQTVEIGEGQTLSAVQICPNGKNGKVKSHYVTYSKIQAPISAAQMRLRLRKVDGTLQTKYNITINTSHTRDDQEYEESNITLTAGEYIFWECIAVAANDTPVEAGFSLQLEDV